MSRAMQRAIVDLPQPDSPTTPSVSPALPVKVTPSTAFAHATCFSKQSTRVTGKYFFRSSTTSSSAATSNSPGGHRRTHLLSLTGLGFIIEVARLHVFRSRPHRLELGLLVSANLHREGAPWVEATA